MMASKRQVPEPSSLSRLDRRASMMRRLGEAAWEELPGGVLRVEQKSPQFALVGFMDDLVTLAAKDGYRANVDGPWVNVWRGGYRAGWKQIRRWLVLTPAKAPGDGQGETA